MRREYIYAAIAWLAVLFYCWCLIRAEITETMNERIRFDNNCQSPHKEKP
jgi:hypothetical protein